jgi:hypothetical protein
VASPFSRIMVGVGLSQSKDANSTLPMSSRWKGGREGKEGVSVSGRVLFKTGARHKRRM